MKDKEISLDEFLYEDDKQNIEEERLKIDNIEHLEELYDDYKDMTRTTALNAVIFGVISLSLIVKKIINIDFLPIENLLIYSLGTLMITHTGMSLYYNEKKEKINERINNIKTKSKK